MTKTKAQVSWIIYPNSNEHAAPKGFEGIIPPIGTKIQIDKYTYFVHQHVMYYDDKKKPIYSIRAREARPQEIWFNYDIERKPWQTS